MRIEPGVIRSYDKGTHKADVQLEVSLSTYLRRVRVLSTIPWRDVRVGASCTVLFYDEHNPGDALVVGVYGTVPADIWGVAGWPLVQRVIAPFEFAVGTGVGLGFANRAAFVPVVLAVERQVTTVRIGEVTTSSGNIDVGLYTSKLVGSEYQPDVRLVSSGSVACPAVGANRDVGVSSTTLGPGLFFLALACDNTTAAFRRFFDVALSGVWLQSNAFPLPASAAVDTADSGRWYVLGCYQ